MPRERAPLLIAPRGPGDRARRIAAITVVALLIAAAYFAGLFDLLREPERTRAVLAETGIWAPLLYVLLFSLCEPFGVPGVLFVLPAALIWPAWQAFGLSMAGSLGASMVGFSLARWIGRAWVEANLPERFRRYDARLAEHALATVILVRLLFFLAPPAHWVLGLSSVRVRIFLLGSAIGYVPGIALLTFVGEGLFEWLAR